MAAVPREETGNERILDGVGRDHILGSQLSGNAVFRTSSGTQLSKELGGEC
jgi:hypothetical protein